jgi:hypothetical protein
LQHKDLKKNPTEMSFSPQNGEFSSNLATLSAAHLGPGTLRGLPGLTEQTKEEKNYNHKIERYLAKHDVNF